VSIAWVKSAKYCAPYVSIPLSGLCNWAALKPARRIDLARLVRAQDLLVGAGRGRRRGAASDTDAVRNGQHSTATAALAYRSAWLRAAALIERTLLQQPPLHRQLGTGRGEQLGSARATEPERDDLDRPQRRDRPPLERSIVVGSRARASSTTPATPSPPTARPPGSQGVG